MENLASRTTTKRNTKQDKTTNSPGRCLGFLPPSDDPDPRSSRELLNESLDPAGLLPPLSRSRSTHAQAGDPAVPGAAAEAATAALVTAGSAAGGPGRNSSTPKGSSEAWSSRSGLMEGELGKVSAGPAPAPAADPGLLLLRRADAHLPRESPEDLFAGMGGGGGKQGGVWWQVQR